MVLSGPLEVVVLLYWVGVDKILRVDTEVEQEFKLTFRGAIEIASFLDQVHE